MKKLLLVLFALVLGLGVLAACDEPTTPPAGDTPGTQETPGGGEIQKFEGTLYLTTPFSEGKALASTSGNGNTVCIDKNGNVLFSLDVSIASYQSSFKSGLILLPDGRFCDSKGSLTAPADVGVTKFYDAALEGGYIIVEVIESTFDSTSKKIGVMNTDFEWVYQPSEELYPQIKIQESVYSSDRYYDGYLYMASKKTFWNLKTGEITAECSVEIPCDAWITYSDNTYRDLSGNSIKLSGQDIANNVFDIGNFVNAKAPVVYYNSEAKASYFNYVDENGGFSFEPVKVFDYMAHIVMQDETTVLIGRGSSSTGCKLIRSYDRDGNFLGELDLLAFGTRMSWNITSFEDGIIVVQGYRTVLGQGSSYETYVYDRSFNRLF